MCPVITMISLLSTFDTFSDFQARTLEISLTLTLSSAAHFAVIYPRYGFNFSGRVGERTSRDEGSLAGPTRP